jgi:hypothetical protein
MQALLSFDQSPPLSAPLRFFLTAPLFLILAGALAVIEGGAIFASRWTPAALAATHLLAVGFMLQVMVGALIQILPVLAGANLARPRLIAGIVHPGLALGALALAAGFLTGSPGWLHGAGVLLAISLTVFLIAAGLAIFRVPSTSPSIRGLKLSVFALAITAAGGLFMLLVLTGGWGVPLMPLADLHAAWGLGGWAGILLMAVAYVVVPMFQLTPGYPARPAWALPLLLLAALLLWSLAWAVSGEILQRLAQAGLAVGGLLFVGQTMKLQAARRRARPDSTFRYWQGALYASLLALLMLLASAVQPALSELPAWTTGFGVLILLGGLSAFIAGMLYKILPFLLWLHLQPLARPGRPVPPMNKLLADKEGLVQWRLYLAAVVLGSMAAIRADWFAMPAGICLVISAAWLWWNLIAAARNYRRARVAAEYGA